MIGGEGNGMKKRMSAREAAGLVRDGSCVWLAGGGGGINDPCHFLGELEQSFLETGHPRDMTLCHSAGMGDKQGGGADHFAHAGMVKKVVGSHWTWSVRMQELAAKEEIEAYVLPQGVMSQMTRDIAGGRPGLISRIGLGTFVDPRVEGGCMNRRSTEQLAQVLEIGGREYLLYKAFPIDVAVIRGSTADEDGNISYEQEGIVPEALSAAQAAKNSGGIVIAQVKRVVARGTIKPLQVKVPGVLVDAVVVDPEQRQSLLTDYDPSLSGEYRVVIEDEDSRMPLTERKVIARRAAEELGENDVCNLGFGMPDGVAAVVKEERGLPPVLSVEQGIIGGIPQGGSNFGLVRNPMAILDQPYQFDWYDGGGLDVTVLSFAQFDRHGNVNVSKFGGRINGVGGFINISQGAKKVVFVGTFTAGGFCAQVEEGTIRIMTEGRNKKLVSQVEQISFSGAYARENGQKVVFVTERAVFELTPEGVKLTEIAPGMDLKRDILDQMEFVPVMDEEIKIMPARYFKA